MAETGKDSTAAASAASAGLRGVVAAQSSIGDVNGEQGILIYQGYNIHDLAEHSTFEEVVFLLWNGRLPKRDELDALKADFFDYVETSWLGDDIYEKGEVSIDSTPSGEELTQRDN